MNMFSLFKILHAPHTHTHTNAQWNAFVPQVSWSAVTYLHRAFDRGMETATRFPVRQHMKHMPAQTVWDFPSLVSFPCLRPLNVFRYVLGPQEDQCAVSHRASRHRFINCVIVVWPVSGGGSNNTLLESFSNYSSHEPFVSERYGGFLGLVVIQQLSENTQDLWKWRGLNSGQPCECLIAHGH